MPISILAGAIGAILLTSWLTGSNSVESGSGSSVFSVSGRPLKEQKLSLYVMLGQHD